MASCGFCKPFSWPILELFLQVIDEYFLENEFALTLWYALEI
jgi:hypothetical protein